MRSSVWKYIVVVAGIALSGSAFAAWSSGGGELIKDADNPWFLTNTEQATYCIEVAPQGFPYDASRMQAMLEEVFSYWKHEFAKTKPMFPAARVATQRFQRVSCNASTDIKFQFGFMTSDQMAVITNPTDYISLAVRTDYDRVQLRGRGFVYIAAEDGQFRPNSDKVFDHPWQVCDGCRLKRVLAHEIGHIFGIPHQTGNELNLMAAETPENMVNKNFTGDVPGPTTPLPYFFVHENDFEYQVCYDQRFPDFYRKIWQFFSASDAVSCIQLKRRDHDYFISGKEGGSDYAPLGTVEWQDGTGEVPYAVKVHITSDQQVLPAIALGLPYVGSAEIERSEEGAKFRALAGPSRNIIIRIDPHGVDVDGYLNGQMQRNLIVGTRPY